MWQMFFVAIEPPGSDVKSLHDLFNGQVTFFFNELKPDDRGVLSTEHSSGCRTLSSCESSHDSRESISWCLGNQLH